MGAGNYRYVYALMNYDFDPQFNSFSLDLPDGLIPGNMSYSDADSNSANDWLASTSNNELSWTAPASTGLDWGHMATFSFEIAVAPASGRATFTALEPPVNFAFSVPVLAMVIDTIHKDGFESP